MQRYHIFRTDPIPQILRIGRYQSDTTVFFFFFFLCNLEFLYFSVLTLSSLFCELNTIYYSVSQLVGQKWVARPFWEGRGLFSAKETTSTKNVILNAFLMRDFYFKRRAWKPLTLSDHLTPRQSKERKSAWETRCPDSVSAVRWDVDRFNDSVIIPRCFRNTLWNKKVSHLRKNELSCPVRCYSVLVACILL